MSKKILMESTKSNFKVLEKKPANVLKRIQGVLSDFKSNRNGRIYPRELWENVLNSDYVKEMIESHGLVGELDHPEERLEISLQNVSHVINDMWIEGDKVMGTIDILPTPSGKIVSELLDYGTDIGISSRGAGSVGPNNVVDPDYQFVTFDFVARPSCEAARLNMIVESVQPEIDTNSDDKVKNILEGYKTNLKEGTPMDFEYIGRDDWGRHIIKSKDTGKYFGDINLTKAGKERDLSSASWHTYSGNDPYEGEPDVSMQDDIIVNIVNPEDIPTDYQRNEYELLSRLKSDCDYFLGNGDGYEGHLWAKDINSQIAKMRELYDQLEEKPEWLTLDDINNYERKMKHYQAGSKNKKYQVITTVQKEPGNYETRVQGIYDSPEQASDVCGELRAQGIGATYQELDESVKLNEGLKTIYNIDVDWLNNLRKEYESGNLSESELEDIIEGYVTGTLNIRCEKDPEAWIGATSFAFKNIVKDFSVNESVKLKESDEYTLEVLDKFDSLLSEALNTYSYEEFITLCGRLREKLDTYQFNKAKFINENLKLSESTYIIKQGTGPFGEYNICEWEAESPEQAVDEFLNMNPKYKDGYYGKITAVLKENVTLTEAKMTDQEVYKTVLTWYKQQIENGNMTLNQCYALLSDKAKVSLNKMVDQSKIKESIMNKTIKNLINESIELNKKGE